MVYQLVLSKVIDATNPPNTSATKKTKKTQNRKKKDLLLAQDTYASVESESGEWSCPL